MCAGVCFSFLFFLFTWVSLDLLCIPCMPLAMYSLLFINKAYIFWEEMTIGT